MENLKIRVLNEQESKDAQELFFELGYGFEGCKNKTVVIFEYVNPFYFFAHKDSDLTVSLDNSVFSLKVDYKEITLDELRDMVVLKRNDVNDATHWNYRNHSEYLVQGDKEYYMHNGKWFLSDCPNDLNPIEKGMKQEKTEKAISNAWDVQVGGNHYKQFKIQPMQFALENKLDAAQQNVIKYIMRHSFKNGKQDLEKAKHYIDLMIEFYYG